MLENVHMETLQVLVFASVLALPLAFQAITPARRRRPVPAQRARHDAARNVTALAQAVARKHEHGYVESSMQLNCRECGQLSPPVLFSRAGLVPLGALGYVITATCRACDGPLISRVLTEVDAENCRVLGIIDGEPLERDMRAWLADL